MPTSVVITGSDSVGVLKQGLQAAYSFKPLEPVKVAALLGRTARQGSNGDFEQFKTSQRFDGTEKNPRWLDSAKL